MYLCNTREDYVSFSPTQNMLVLLLPIFLLGGGWGAGGLYLADQTMQYADNFESKDGN